MKWIPNSLTVMRIFVALVFPAVPREWWLAAVGFALITEYLDGKLARTFHWESQLGQLLDPLADKLFAASVGITLVFAHKLEWYEFLFLSVKDVVVTLIFAAVLLFYRSGKNLAKFRPNFAGKLNTAFQYVIFISALFFLRPYDWTIYLAGSASVVSATLYSYDFVQELKSHHGGAGA